MADLNSKRVTILGGGPAGLSAGKVLTDAGLNVTVFEMADDVGGLSRTHENNGFRFDLGGHRFFTKKNQLNEFLRDLLGDELIKVDRSSKIFLRGRYFNYPPTLGNAFFGFGPFRAMHIISSFLWERMKPERPGHTLEDAIIRDYGRALFEQFFEPYNVKVWGIPCDKVSAEWVAQRIKGLSLVKSVKSALGLDRNNKPVSLIDNFTYPDRGIGRITDKLREKIEGKAGRVFVRHRVEKIYHDGARIGAIGVRNSQNELVRFDTTDVLNSIPITELVRSFDPAPPPEVIEATRHLAFRDLMVVNISFDHPPITKETWIYIPEPHISFGRIHEPTNWSAKMSPAGKTSLAFEFWCNEGDWMWNLDDETLIRMTLDDFVKLGLAPGVEKSVIGSRIVRCRKAYPMYVIGYEKPLNVIKNYLSRFLNLILMGRYGTFMYHNMDHCIETGIRAAENVLGASHDVTDVHDRGEYLEEKR